MEENNKMYITTPNSISIISIEKSGLVNGGFFSVAWTMNGTHVHKGFRSHVNAMVNF